MPQTAFAYLRVSGKGQVKGDGIPRQRQAVKAYAKQHRLTIIEEFTDEGVSGTKELENRPGLAALLDRAEHNGGTAVLVERADRLARDLMIGEVILGQFRNIGSSVIECDGGSDLTAANDDPTKTLIRQVLGAVSQFEKAVLVMKLRASRDRKSREAGRRIEGQKPFGELPGEATTLARMRELHRKRPHRQRRGYAAIARILDEEGRRPRRASTWSRQAVFVILQ